MAGVNSTSVVGLKPAAAVPQAAAASPAAKRVQVAPKDRAAEGRRAALLGLAAVFAVTATTGSAKAGIIDEYLEKSKANKVVTVAIAPIPEASSSSVASVTSARSSSNTAMGVRTSRFTRRAAMTHN